MKKMSDLGTRCRKQVRVNGKELPYDCWCRILEYFEVGSDFVILALSVPGLYFYMKKMRIPCSRTILYKFSYGSVDVDVRSILYHIGWLWLTLERNDNAHDANHMMKVLFSKFPLMERFSLGRERFAPELPKLMFEKSFKGQIVPLKKLDFANLDSDITIQTDFLPLLSTLRSLFCRGSITFTWKTTPEPRIRRLTVKFFEGGQDGKGLIQPSSVLSEIERLKIEGRNFRCLGKDLKFELFSPSLQILSLKVSSSGSDEIFCRGEYERVELIDTYFPVLKKLSIVEPNRFGPYSREERIEECVAHRMNFRDSNFPKLEKVSLYWWLEELSTVFHKFQNMKKLHYERNPRMGKKDTSSRWRKIGSRDIIDVVPERLEDLYILDVDRNPHRVLEFKPETLTNVKKLMLPTSYLKNFTIDDMEEIIQHNIVELSIYLTPYVLRKMSNKFHSCKNLRFLTLTCQLYHGKDRQKGVNNNILSISHCPSLEKITLHGTENRERIFETQFRIADCKNFFHLVLFADFGAPRRIVRKKKDDTITNNIIDEDLDSEDLEDLGEEEMDDLLITDGDETKVDNFFIGHSTCPNFSKLTLEGRHSFPSGIDKNSLVELELKFCSPTLFSSEEIDGYDDFPNLEYLSISQNVLFKIPGWKQRQRQTQFTPIEKHVCVSSVVGLRKLKKMYLEFSSEAHGDHEDIRLIKKEKKSTRRMIADFGLEKARDLNDHVSVEFRDVVYYEDNMKYEMIVKNIKKVDVEELYSSVSVVNNFIRKLC